MQEHLPQATQDAFLATVTEFVWLPWKHAMVTAVSDASDQPSSQVYNCPSSGPAYAVIMSGIQMLYMSPCMHLQKK